MKKNLKYLACLMLAVFAYSCSTTKNIPEEEYLLNDFEIKADKKQIDEVILEDFLRQKPNTSLPLIGKFRLGLYNAAGQDTTKWLTRFIRKLGQPPVIYSSRLTAITATQLEKELSNWGYLSAEVDTILKPKNKKMDVVYQIHSGDPYRIRNYEYTIDNPQITKMLTFAKRFTEVKSGNLFDKEVLETERERLNNMLRNVGYYDFSKENLYYRADTTLNSHEVDLFLTLRETPDSLGFHRYQFRNITVLSGYDITSDDNKENFLNPDTTYKNGITIIRGKNKFLRNSFILRNNYLRPGRFYSDRGVSRTYSSFSGVGAIKQAGIQIIPVASNDSVYLLDAEITLSPANLHWFQAGIEGTNSAGDIGVAPNVSYQHRNIFNGAEILSVKLRGAYEFVRGDEDNYYEYGIETSLSFPQFIFPWMKQSWKEMPSASTQISIGLNNQHRSKYTRQFFNAAYTFRWASNRNRFNHALDLLEVNYVRMPFISDDFQEILDGNPILKATYENQLIARTGYNLTYTFGQRRSRYPRNTYTLRVGGDIAGWLPRLVTTISKPGKNSVGQYEIAGIGYAEYFKVDVSFSQTRVYDRKNSIAYNVTLGVANPFGNSTVLPFERRYFSGGANSVRGWSTRELGPGSYKPDGSTSFVNQVGDIKLDMSIEYRRKLTTLFEVAGYIDAGNVWTIRNYEGQEGGLFKFSEFYKEIALSYGLGIRFDLGFLLLRFDTGMKAYDPSRDTGDRFIMFKPKFSRDFAWHFAIGYPF